LSSAQFLAGVMLAEGIGTRADRARAQVWLQRAADGGNPDAAAALGRMRTRPVGD
jgi:TPR repeat protein